MIPSRNVQLILFGILALLKLLYGHPNIKGNVKKEKVISSCGFNHKASNISGIILSPEFPSKYPNNRECHWYLSSNQNITLEIVQLDIEEQLGCRYDYLDIYERSVHNETLLYRLCGGIQNTLIITNSSDLHLVFKSDFTDDGKGFELSYYSGESLKPSGVNICPSISTAEGVGFVFSKGYPRQNYEDNAHCVYPIQVEKEEKIYLNFLDLRLEKDRSCNNDFISVYDGSNNKSSSIGKFCFGIPPPIISTGSQLLIEFKSDNEYNGVGFMLGFSSKGFVDSSGNIGAILTKQK